MAKMTLRDNHPAKEALHALADKADELGIRLEFWGTRSFLYWTDEAGVEHRYDWCDMDDEDQALAEFPPCFETKCFYEKEK